MRWPLAVALVLLSGCLSQHHDSNATSHPIAEYPPTDMVESPSVANATPAPPLPIARIRDVGLAWSNCEFRGMTVNFKQEWTAELVPPEYRPLNTPGNFGAAGFRIFRCEAASIGNMTYLESLSFGFFGIFVEAPEAVQGAGSNLYLLDFLSDNEVATAQLREAVPSTKAVTFTFDEASYGAASPEGFGASVDETEQLSQSQNGTPQVRFHWKTGDQACWLDLEAVEEVESQTVVSFSGLDGNPATVTGPLHKSAELSSRGRESGHFAAPRCQVASP